MAVTDFPAWFGASVYGGLACAVLSALVIASWSLLRRRGLSGQVMVALLICLIASALDAAPIVWSQDRLGVYGPGVSVSEVTVALLFTALCGWSAPLGAMIWYVLYAVPQSGSLSGRSTRLSSSQPANPGRMRLVRPDGQAWGVLEPESPATNSRVIPLTREVVLIGRDPGADLTLDDDRVSRFHAELRWEDGQPWLIDLASLNGTKLNQLSVASKSPVHDHDLLEFGSSHFRFLTPTPPTIRGDSAGESNGAASILEVETRKTAGMSGSHGSSYPALALVWNDGVSPEREWILSSPVTTIGRDASCGVTLPDNSVSRTHAQVARQPTGYYIVDLESRNGVYLNGEQITAPTNLNPGDVLRLGDASLSVRDITNLKASTPTSEHDVTSGPDSLALTMRLGTRDTSKPRFTPPRVATEETQETQEHTET